MKFLLSILAVILCVVAITGILSQRDGLFGVFGESSTAVTTQVETTSFDSFPTTKPIETDDMILAHYVSDIPGFESSYNVRCVGEKYPSSAGIDNPIIDVPIVLGSVVNGGKTAVGYTFSKLKVGQKYLINYDIYDVPESFGLTKYYFRQGTSGGFTTLNMPNLKHGCIFFTAKTTSVDLILMIIDTPSTENLNTYGQFIDESTGLYIAEVTAK